MGYPDAGAGKGAKMGYLDAGVFSAPAYEGRWRWEEPEWAKTGFPDAGVSIALACGGRWR
jgi:hypothetical protein